jgi:hypothetical protein
MVEKERMVKRRMDQGKGVRPVDSVPVAVPGLRPGTLRGCFLCVAFAFSFTLLQECTKQWVIELVAAAS